MNTAIVPSSESFTELTSTPSSMNFVMRTGLKSGVATYTRMPRLYDTQATCPSSRRSPRAATRERGTDRRRSSRTSTTGGHREPGPLVGRSWAPSTAAASAPWRAKREGGTWRAQRVEVGLVVGTPG